GLSAAWMLRQRLTLIMTRQTPKRLGLAGQVAVFVLAAGLLPLMPTLVRPSRGAAPPPEKKQKQQDARNEEEQPEPSEFGPEGLSLTGADHEVFSVDVSRDGRWVASGGGGYTQPGEVRVFSLPARRLVRVFPERRGVVSVALSPDGQSLA